MLVWIFYDTKTTKAILKPYKRLKSSHPNNYSSTQRKTFYGAKNALKRHRLVFYSIVHTEIYPNFHLSRTREHVHAHVNLSSSRHNTYHQEKLNDKHSSLHFDLFP